MDENKTTRRSGSDTEVHRRQRSKNYTVLAVLVFLAVAFFAITIVKMSPAGVI